MTEQTTTRPEQTGATVTELKPKPAPRPKQPSAASRTAAATQGKTSKPAPKKEEKPELTATDKKRIVAERLIGVGAQLAKEWDAKETGVSKAFAAEMIASYLSYTPGSFWLAPLPIPTTGRGSKHTLQ